MFWAPQSCLLWSLFSQSHQNGLFQNVARSCHPSLETPCWLLIVCINPVPKSQQAPGGSSGLAFHCPAACGCSQTAPCCSRSKPSARMWDSLPYLSQVLVQTAPPQRVLLDDSISKSPLPGTPDSPPAQLFYSLQINWCPT